ncbi:phosphatase PAP2 family protein [Streptomyces celluloflavus]|uniref:Phosphatase PAP2 family protein n=1 Tax=Streptomyces celluloflavus TaxID=58344 RepID=A0ABW7RMX9_9ACTN|nr:MULTISPECIES: phosphatase PAP2 family protein [Streptomyces]MYU52154.1 phosphatase PAP2 family protein [Streptomyces sp. SID7805]
MNSTDLYRDITDLAHDSPDWIRTLADLGTSGGLLLLMAVAVLGWWRSRRGEARAVALAVLVPVATIAAYALSEIVKSLVNEERPCRAVAGAAASIVPCPPEGDWSFPSNHSTLAAALAVGIVFAWRAALWLALPVALLTGFSRVFVGVHYPHDVLVGLGLGTLVAALCVALLTGTVTNLVLRMRSGRWRILVSA